MNNVAILSLPTDKGSIDGYGAPDKFLESVNFLFGKQTFTGEALGLFGCCCFGFCCCCRGCADVDTQRQGCIWCC